MTGPRETPEEAGLRAGRKAAGELRPFTPAEIRQMALLTRRIDARDDVVPPADADDAGEAPS